MLLNILLKVTTFVKLQLNVSAKIGFVELGSPFGLQLHLLQRDLATHINKPLHVHVCYSTKHA